MDLGTEIKPDTRQEDQRHVLFEDNYPEPLRYNTWVLRVSIHCEGCKRKIKKILSKIDGVYTTNIDVKQQKVTVIGNVEPEFLIKKIMKAGRHAELWPTPPMDNNNDCNYQKNARNEETSGDEDDENNNNGGDGGGGSGGGGGGGGGGGNCDQVKQVVTFVNGQPQPQGDGAPKKKKKKKKKKKSLGNTTVVMEGGGGGGGSGGGGCGGGGGPPQNDGPPETVIYSAPPDHHIIHGHPPHFHQQQQNPYPTVHSPPRHHPQQTYSPGPPPPSFYQTQQTQTAPSYTVSYNTAHGMSNGGNETASYYAAPGPIHPTSYYSYEYVDTGYESPPPEFYSYRSQPSDSFEALSEGNPNSCCVM
ncbi:hypothetical protein CARUB_v10001264mg [Capsella rubella]|uniref:HMA domain-containing protein n=2 Tax=Capsella rubella TaxID=81985 RepID=R0FFC0_9BRAS|nr:hypothetical protein CARUB_v10001264mg [Capsella rubella]